MIRATRPNGRSRTLGNVGSVHDQTRTALLRRACRSAGRVHHRVHHPAWRVSSRARSARSHHACRDPAAAAAATSSHADAGELQTMPILSLPKRCVASGPDFRSKGPSLQMTLFWPTFVSSTINLPEGKPSSLKLPWASRTVVAATVPSVTLARARRSRNTAAWLRLGHPLKGNRPPDPRRQSGPSATIPTRANTNPALRLRIRLISLPAPGSRSGVAVQVG